MVWLAPGVYVQEGNPHSHSFVEDAMANAPDLKKMSVRRLMTFIEQSIRRGTKWAVFEPNGEPLWAEVRQSVLEFLAAVWLTGALQGTTAADAFFVRCDGTTTTQADIESGRLILEVGVAPVQPAEFMVVRITQKTLAPKA